MAERSLDWAVPLMRAGYAGRGLTYLLVAGLSLWAIWRGGEAKGTSEVLAQIETSPFGTIVLWLIGLGLLSYMFWRVLDGIADLEREGSDATGLLGRCGMAVTGLIHGAIGTGAIWIALTAGDGSGNSVIVLATTRVMAMPLGPWLVGLVGLITLGAGGYYLHKGWTRAYRANLAANHFTRHWSPALQAGVIAQGITVGIIGGFLLYAGLTAKPQEAGGLGQTFSWLSDQVYGKLLVTGLCAGLLGFALFLFTNAAYRIVPRLSDPDLPRLGNAAD